MDKRIERFEKKGNKILDAQMIENFGNTRDCHPDKLIQIYKSAIIDHSEVDGIKYYTKYPFSPFQVLVKNDVHNRALIAHQIGEIIQKSLLSQDQVDSAIEILKKLKNPHYEYRQTQLIAWNSLSKAVEAKIPLLGIHIQMEDLLKSIASPGIENIGAQKVVFSLLTQEELREHEEQELKEIVSYIFNQQNFNIKAILYYKILTTSLIHEDRKQRLLKDIQIPHRLATFIQTDYFSPEYSTEEIIFALENIGMTNPPFVATSSEARIAFILINECLLELCIPALIYLSNPQKLAQKNKERQMALCSLCRKDTSQKGKVIPEQLIDTFFIDEIQEHNPPASV
ncbi:MAG: hypothetical protein ACMUIP_06660 [bacterium]